MKDIPYTPGPWTPHVENHLEEWWLVMAGGKGGQLVANVNTESCPDSASAPAFRVMPAAANARLIAASPRLFEALCELVSAAGRQLEQGDGEQGRANQAVLAKALTVIAEVDA